MYIVHSKTQFLARQRVNYSERGQPDPEYRSECRHTLLSNALHCNSVPACSSGVSAEFGSSVRCRVPRVCLPPAPCAGQFPPDLGRGSAREGGDENITTMQQNGRHKGGKEAAGKTLSQYKCRTSQIPESAHLIIDLPALNCLARDSKTLLEILKPGFQPNLN